MNELPCPICGDPYPKRHINIKMDGDDMMECSNPNCPLYQRIPISWWEMAWTLKRNTPQISCDVELLCPEDLT